MNSLLFLSWVGPSTFLHEYVCMILLGLDKNDLNESIFHDSMHKIISDIHKLVLWLIMTFSNMGDCSNIVNSYYDWRFHQNLDQLHHLYIVLYLFWSLFRKCSELCFTREQSDSLTFDLPADWYTQQENAEQAHHTHLSLHVFRMVDVQEYIIPHLSSVLSIMGLIFNP